MVVVDELAFIVNIPNKTVVTAMNRSETEDNVFTNINGAVIYVAGPWKEAQFSLD